MKIKSSVKKKAGQHYPQYSLTLTEMTAGKVLAIMNALEISGSPLALEIRESLSREEAVKAAMTQSA